MNVAIDRGAGLPGEWKQAAFGEEALQHALECCVVFGAIQNNEAAPIFGPYLHGLALLSKSDIHLSCETLARSAFTESLRSVSKHFGDWDGSNETLVPSVNRVFETIIPEQHDRSQLLNILSFRPQAQEGRLADAVSAKRLTDLYLASAARRLWSERIKQMSQGPVP